MIELDGPPPRWVSRGGLPAPATRGHGGLPAYETEDGKLVVFENLVAFETSTVTSLPGVADISASIGFFPTGYDRVAHRSKVVGDHELVALHDDPDAMWSWRPLIYRLTRGRGLDRLGSQIELEWRWGLAAASERFLGADAALADLTVECVKKRLPFEEYEPLARALIDEWMSKPDPRIEANALAKRILVEHLAPQQRIDLGAYGRFSVRGTINRLYEIEPGNGATIVDPLTHKPLVSLCLHPERWMPHEDVALATKLLIESGPDGEEEMLAGARARPLRRPWPRPTAANRRAWRIERELLPSPHATALLPRPNRLS